ncbi:MAG: glutamate formiminotransferase [Actinomycetota bacterium]|nr:glutamate formiminotransferase [Actinomycetota bacterium]
MTLVAVPNVSEGRDHELLRRAVQAIEATHTRVLDLHSDAVHNRSVLTLAGRGLVQACVELAAVASSIDIRSHRGVHPRLGGLDVCPFVPHDEDMVAAVHAARTTAHLIGELGLPVYLYGHAARRSDTRELPDLRRGGLDSLIERSTLGLLPDEGPPDIDPARGVVCVGARGVLVAFNVWLRSDLPTAKRIAAAVRSRSVRALGLDLGEGQTQVSLNLIEPHTTGVDEAFGAVAAEAERAGAAVVATELVGLVPERFLPQDATVARLLIEPGHSLEEALEVLS